MTNERAQYWLRYTRKVQDALGIGGWIVHLVQEDPTEGALASIQPNYGRSTAYLRLSNDLEDANPEEQRQCITHEVLHLVTADVAELVLAGPLTDLLGKPAHYAFAESWRLAYESSHDWLATILANVGAIPLPPRR